MLKRLRIVGLCLVAVFAMSSVAASSALATEDTEDTLEAGTANVVANVDANGSVWVAGGIEVKCTKSSAGITVSGAPKLPVTLTANNPALTYEECESTLGPIANPVVTGPTTVTFNSGVEESQPCTAKGVEGNKADEGIGKGDELQDEFPDCIAVNITKITFKIATCEIEVGPVSIKASELTEGEAGPPEEKGSFKFNGVPVPFKTKGFFCPSSPATYTANYNLNTWIEDLS